MKWILPVFLCFSLCCAACIPPRQVKYELPNDFVETDQKDMRLKFKKGKALYGVYCASCHTKVVDGKKVEPRFLKLQMETYLVRLKPIAHRGQFSAQQLPDDEVKLVFLYLMNNQKRQPVQPQK